MNDCSRIDELLYENGQRQLTKYWKLLYFTGWLFELFDNILIQEMKQ
jgi:hypothetical protein